MSAYTIDCKRYKLNDTDYSMAQDKTITSIDNKEMYLTFYIDCEDDEDNNSFDFEQYGNEEIVIERNRCELEVYIKENKTPYNKEFRILCTHSNDKEVYVEIKIVQIAEEFKIMFTSTPTCIGPTNIQQELKSIINNSTVVDDDSNYNYYEQIGIDVCVIGGSKRYRIESILKCHEEPVDGGSPQYIYSSFDGGFIYVKKPNTLLIRNYGRPFLLEDDYYIITLCHEDYREIKAKIKITYSQVQQTNNNSQQDNTQPTQTNLQESNIYKPHDYITHTTNDENETDTICQLIMNSGGQNIVTQSDGYKIVGQVDASLSFKVMEGESTSSLQVSNLMVKVISHGNWCSVVLDEQNTSSLSNRKIKISILNKPISERKTKFTISVVDYPNVSKTFVLTNTIS